MKERALATDAPFTVPTAPHRPGDSPPPSSTWEEQPEDLGRPDPITCVPEDTQAHAHGLIRVLGDDHEAKGAWNPGLDEGTLIQGLEHMMRLRIFDDRMMKMQRTGKLSFYMKSLGEEAIAIAQTMALSDQDWIVPSYRQPGAQFVRGRDMVSMICHCIGNTEDNIRGRQMPVHYSYREGRFVSISSPVGTQFPQAVGIAMASAYKGEDEVTITWLGDGTSAQGDYHYALNFAGVFRPPVILNVVNNQWAISTHANIATGGPTFAARGLAYGIPCLRVDGNDFLALHAATTWARERAASGAGATHLEIVTYRAGGHSSSDDPSRYRPEDEASCWPGGDPIERLKSHLMHIGAWSEDQHAELEERLDAEVMAAYKEAVTHGDLASGPFPPASTIFTEVYGSVPWHLQEQREQLGK